MRLGQDSPSDARWSACWGSGSGGHGHAPASRVSSGPGEAFRRPGRHALTIVLALLLVLTAALAGSASGASGKGSSGTTTSTSGSGSSTSTTSYKAFMTKKLNDATLASPKSLFNVIVKGSRGVSTSSLVSSESSAISANPATGTGVRKQYEVINGTASRLSGKQIQALAKLTGVAAITEDVKMRSTGFSNAQIWPDVSQASSFYNATSATPTIAIVDSGVDG